MTQRRLFDAGPKPRSGKTKREEGVDLKKHLKQLALHIKYKQEMREGMACVELECQDMLFLPRQLGIDSFELTGGGVTIDASVGSSGYVAPKKIFTAINTFNRDEVVEYGFRKEFEELEKNLADYLVEEKIIDAGTTVEFTEPGQIVKANTVFATLGCGSQHIAQIAFKVIIKHPKDIIFCDAPTYGLFLKLINSAEGEYECVPLKAEDNYKPNPQTLANAIIAKNNSLKEDHVAIVKEKIAKIKKYILEKDPNSKNVYKLIGQLEKKLKSTNSLGNKVICQLNMAVAVYVTTYLNKKEITGATLQKAFKIQLIDKLRIPFGNRARGYLNINPHNPTGVVMTQPDVDEFATALADVPKLIVIDDLAHRGISLSTSQIGFFSRTVLKDRTVSLFSFSKSFALAGMRAGFAIGPHDLIDQVAKEMYESQVVPPLSVLKTIKAVVTTPKEKRDSYLAKCNNTYRFRLALVKALIDGIDSIQDEAYKERILQVYTECGLGDEPYIWRGIDYLSLLTNPEGCFFVLLDFSEYKNSYFGETQLKDGIDFAVFLYYLADVETIPNEANGYFDKPTLRFSLTISEGEHICPALVQIKRALAYLTVAPNPKFNYDAGRVFAQLDSEPKKLKM